MFLVFPYNHHAELKEKKSYMTNKSDSGLQKWGNVLSQTQNLGEEYYRRKVLQ